MSSELAGLRPQHGLRPKGSFLIAATSAIGWTLAGAILLHRRHHVYDYTVTPTTADFTGLLIIGGIGLLLGVGIWCAARQNKGRQSHAVLWLHAAYTIPLLALLRFCSMNVPLTFLEPLFFAFVTGAAARHMLNVKTREADEETNTHRWLWPLLVVAAASGFGVWWFLEAREAYAHYLLDYADFGHYARRVINTWEGRGFLKETPSLPPFWDHFHPGLALLAPLWGLWPDASLFLAIQAACLAAPAVGVWGLARRLGATPAGAAAWASAYLVFPPVGQLNLNFSYGWHPVSLALPTMVGAVWAFATGRRLMALALAVLGCSFQEDIIVAFAGLSAGLAVTAWLHRRPGDQTATLGWSRKVPFRPTRPPLWPALAGSTEAEGDLGPNPQYRIWLLLTAAFTIAFIVVWKTTGFAQFQKSLLSHLGSTPGEILTSPIRKAAVFWVRVLRPSSAYFLLALAVPWGLPSVARGWPILTALVVPAGVLLAWGKHQSTSIAFQYATTLIPVLVIASMIGAVRGVPLRRRREAMWAAAVTALAAGTTASIFMGALPWSAQTIPFVVTDDNRDYLKSRRVLLDEVVQRARHRDASILATGRLAAHFLGVRRLETVDEALDRRATLAQEVRAAGAGNTWIELFDWIALDMQDTPEFFGIHQNIGQIREAARAAERAGYRQAYSKDGVVLWGRPPHRRP